MKHPRPTLSEADPQKAPAEVMAKAAAVEVVPWRPWPGVIYVLLVFYAAQIFGWLIISVYPAIHHWSDSQSTDWLQNSVFGQFGFIVLAEGFTLVALYIYLRRHGCTFKTIGLLRPRWSDAAIGLAALPLYFLFYLITVALVTHFVPSLNIDQKQDIGFSNATGLVQLVCVFISLVVLPAFTEELMVRGFLYSSLKKALPVVWAVIITSGLFAVAHLPEGGQGGPLYIAALDTFVLSLVLIYLREKTGSLWASITLHSLKNGIAFVSLFALHLR